MRIWLNDYELNNPAKRVIIHEEIEGLDVPNIRTSKGQRTGQSGSYFGAQIFDSRAISIRGTIFSSNVTEAKQKRRDIQAALPLFPDRLAVRIEDDDGYVYLLHAQVIDFKMPILRSQVRSNFKLELEATDPTIYNASAGSSLTASIKKAVPGGFQFTSATPQFGTSFYFSPSRSNATVDNTGNQTVYPKLIIVGRTTDPIVINRTTGQTFYMENYGVGDDAVTQIDMQAQTARLGNLSQLVDGELPDGVGSSVFGYVALDADWWGVVPGINEFFFTSGGGSDVDEAMLRWLPGLMGI